MSAAIVVLVPVGLAAYTLAISWSLAAANVAGAAIILCLVGARLGKYGFVVGGASVALANYAGAVIRSETLMVWPSLAVGIALFLLLEAAYDWIVALRVSVPWKAYRVRAKSIARTVVIAAAGVFVFATLGYNASLYISGEPRHEVALLAALVVVSGVGGIVLFRARRDLPRDDDTNKKREE